MKNMYLNTSHLLYPSVCLTARLSVHPCVQSLSVCVTVTVFVHCSYHWIFMMMRYSSHEMFAACAISDYKGQRLKSYGTLKFYCVRFVVMCYYVRLNLYLMQIWPMRWRYVAQHFQVTMYHTQFECQRSRLNINRNYEFFTWSQCKHLTLNIKCIHCGGIQDYLNYSYVANKGLYSLNGRTFYRKISWIRDSR